MKPSDALKRSFPFEPTEGQLQFFYALDKFLDSKEPRTVLLLKGYAGTGKTSLVSALVKVLPMFDAKYMLMAPTGRAAKVMSQYSGRMAFTIHKRIYRMTDETAGQLAFEVMNTRQENVVAIIDEASMIYEQQGFGGSGLLKDIFTFLFSVHSTNKLILIGDNAQLPPVGQDISAALDREYLTRNHRAHVIEVTLTEVMRQELDSGILANATALRELLAMNKINIQLSTAGYPDIYRMTGEKLEDGLRYAYDKYGIEQTILICQSNKSANLYNQYIRRQLHFYENELEAGEILMVVRNNYLFSPEESGKGHFIANGDFVEVLKIVTTEEMYGHRYMTLQLRLLDYPAEQSFEANVMLDTIYCETPSLPEDQERALYQEVMASYEEISSRKERKEMMRKDKYLHALQVKFAYALTCHKSQGGQWPAVFVDQGYLKDESSINSGYIKWLYTAVTRATKELFMVNFHPRFFGGN
jgi:exodeoxyribonuclease-5